MRTADDSVRVGIYLCECDGKISNQLDLNKVKTVIQSGADFEYIRVAETFCGKLEQERLADEINKYALNRLLIAGCQDPFLTKQILNIVQQQGVSRYSVEFVDLSGNGLSVEAAVNAVNRALKKMQWRADVGTEEVAVNPEVLVVGGGSEGAAAALAIAASQPVTVIDAGYEGGLPQLKSNKNIIVKQGAKIVDFDGFPGNFTVLLEAGGKKFKQVFGAVVVALEAQPVFDQTKYAGIELGEQVCTLSHFANLQKDFSGQRVTFVLGKADQDSLLSTAQTLKKAIALREAGAAEVSIFYDDMKVSADQLEQDYQLARARGVNFLKYAGELKFYSTPVAVTVEYEEPFLSAAAAVQVKVASDLLVLAEDYQPAPETAALAELLQINLGPDGFFQDDNVHFLPTRSNREGILFVGSCHGPIYASELGKEVAEVAAEVGRFASGKVAVLSLQPRVEAEKCAVCLTCYRSCPHHAIEIVHDESLNNMYHSAAKMHPLACRHCGTCAGECPGKAIQLPVYSDQEILAAIDKPAAIVAYACENSGALAAELASKLDPQLQANLQIVNVPCSGKIDALYLLKALEGGAEGVLLLVCHEDNCKYVWGNKRAEKRKEQVRGLLQTAGIEPERVDLVHVAANQGNQFNAAVRDMADRINQLGPNAGKVRK
jgi:coenzyme F420-reducing hydrogenase delta subunit/Pyruvate/2-oxoacid:ferredoxin oxidoreductase delta subunit